MYAPHQFVLVSEFYVHYNLHRHSYYYIPFMLLLSHKKELKNTSCFVRKLENKQRKPIVLVQRFNAPL